MDLIKAFLDVVLHLQDHLYRLTSDHGAWVYGILFLIIFAETGLVLTPVLPGESLLYAVGAVAANPASGLNVWVAGALMIIAAVIGDAVNYSVGQFAGGYLTRRFPKIIRPEYLQKTQHFFEVYGGKTVILARFVPIVRTFAPFVAGMGAMNRSRFMFFNAVGAVAWVGLILPAGWFLGQLEFVKKRFEVIVLGIIFVSVLPVVWEAWKARKANSKQS